MKREKICQKNEPCFMKFLERKSPKVKKYFGKIPLFFGVHSDGEC